MKICALKTDRLHGTITPPSSKSQAIRALVFALLSPGQSHLYPMLQADDITDACAAIQAMGAEIDGVEPLSPPREGGKQLIVHSSGLPLKLKTRDIYTGNSGITTRFLLPLLGLRDDPTIPVHLDCGDQMRARPMGSLLSSLRDLGMSIRCLEKENSLPLEVSGTLRGGKTQISGVTSQYISALLIALPLTEQDSEIRVDHLNERPYMEITLDWLRRQQIRFEHIQNSDHDIFKIKGRQSYSAFDYTVPGDFSSASYFIAAGALFKGKIELCGLNFSDLQGDKRLIDIVEAMGACVTRDAGKLIIQNNHPLRGIRIDANEIPDLLPTLAVLGTQAQGETEIYNVPQARLKETDRIHSMTQGLRKMGATIIENPDGMLIKQSPLVGATVHGFGDHRTVMSLSLAGLLASGKTIIDDAESIHKTFPEFVEQMRLLGAELELMHD